MKKNILYLIFALFTLPVVILITQQAQRLISQAAYQPANIIIDTLSVKGPVNNNWAAFSQGGEEPPPMLEVVIPKMRELAPRYIRLDHIYDSYSVVTKADRGFNYDFSQLDKTIDNIISTGALPFLSLSYMPSVFTSTGSIIDVPSDWNYWKDLVRATIEHYSGKNAKNLTNVYYEVWNEPELPQFGSWKLSGEKDYRLLYYHAIQGANEAQNVNHFNIGGPSVGSYYANSWVNEFLYYINKNKLRFDFYSWHRYHKQTNIFSSDAISIRNNLSSFPSYSNIPLILTEWGIESENSEINNSNAAAAFTIAAINKFQNVISLAFNFEVKDGPPPNGGKWGLLTHEKNPLPLSPKPRFKAFTSLSQLKGNLLNVSGEGTYISALASKSEQNISVILANYDLAGKNTENVPITFSGLNSASYQLKYTYPLDNTTGTFELVTTNGVINKSFIMPANSILLLELSRNASLVTFMTGKNKSPHDQAIVLNGADSSLTLRAPEFRLESSGTISFDIKPYWADDDSSFLIFDAPYSTAAGTINKLFLAKQKTQDGNILKFGIASNKEELVTQASIDNWQKDTWHHLETGWNKTGLWLTLDDLPQIKQESIVNVYNGEILTLYPIEAALDNLQITLPDQKKTINRFFDGRVDK